MAPSVPYVTVTRCGKRQTSRRVSDEHEPLHVLVQAIGNSEAEAQKKLDEAVDCIELLLTPPVFLLQEERAFSRRAVTS